MKNLTIKMIIFFSGLVVLCPTILINQTYDLDPRIGQLWPYSGGCCTATIVGRSDRIVTAGHCVSYIGQEAVFYAAFAQGRPGVQSVARVIAMGPGSHGNAQNDWAVLELDTPLGNTLGFFPFSTSASWNTYEFKLSGWPECIYPKTYEGIRVTLDRGKDDKFEVFGIRSTEGMSGGPVFHSSMNGDYFIGNYAQYNSRKPGRNPHFGAWVGKYSKYLTPSIVSSPIPPSESEGPKGVLICVHDHWSNCLFIDHDCPDLRHHLGHDFGDKISSIELRGIRGVTLYFDNNYSGRSMYFTHDCPDLLRHNNHKFKDEVSSLRISW